MTGMFSQVNAEERVAVQEIVEQLEHLDATLRVLEHEGRKLEDRIRMCTFPHCSLNFFILSFVVPCIVNILCTRV